jgi:hypothetical protein
MITLIEDNVTHGYKIYRSDVIVKNQSQMIEKIYQSHKVLTEKYSMVTGFNGDTFNSTFLYRTYNTFALTGQSEHFYELYKDLLTLIKLNLRDKKYLWFQSWLNFHRPEQVLKWHNHAWPYHGYISLDPKKTQTVFRDYTINNEVGNIYFGPGHREHKVEILEPYDGHRITLGFDVEYRPAPSNTLLSLIPIV